jgi:hypothetical protein
MYTLTVSLLNIFWSLWLGGKCLSIRLKKCMYMLALVLLVKGEFKHVVLRRILLRACFCVSCVYSGVRLKLLRLSAFWQMSADSWNDCMSDERCAMRLFMELDSCYRKSGGWLKCLLMYIHRYWASCTVWIFHLFKSKFTSKKLTTRIICLGRNF